MNNNIEKELPKLKITSKEKQSKQESILTKELNKRSTVQSIIALILIVIAYIIAIFTTIITKQIDSLIGWISFFILGKYPLIIILILLFIGLILSALSYNNNKKNKMVSLNILLLCIPVIYVIINLIIR